VLADESSGCTKGYLVNITEKSLVLLFVLVITSLRSQKMYIQDNAFLHNRPCTSFATSKPELFHDGQYPTHTPWNAPKKRKRSDDDNEPPDFKKVMYDTCLQPLLPPTYLTLGLDQNQTTNSASSTPPSPSKTTTSNP
jgi:hypothetical protein